MEDLYKQVLMMKWANKRVTNKASMMRKKRLIRKVPKDNSLIIKKHNHRKLHMINIQEKIKAGYYKNPEFD
jgi:hypothetical protein